MNEWFNEWMKKWSMGLSPTGPDALRPLIGPLCPLNQILLHGSWSLILGLQLLPYDISHPVASGSGEEETCDLERHL